MTTAMQICAAIARALGHECAVDDEIAAGCGNLRGLNRAFCEESEGKEDSHFPTTLCWAWSGADLTLRHATGKKRLIIEAREDGVRIAVSSWPRPEPPQTVALVTWQPNWGFGEEWDVPTQGWLVHDVDAGLLRSKPSRAMELLWLDIELGGVIRAAAEAQVASGQTGRFDAQPLLTAWDVLAAARVLDAEGVDPAAPAVQAAADQIVAGVTATEADHRPGGGYCDSHGPEVTLVGADTYIRTANFSELWVRQGDAPWEKTSWRTTRCHRRNDDDEEAEPSSPDFHIGEGGRVEYHGVVAVELPPVMPDDDEELIS
ncbi:MAG: hypothetical protein WCO52_05370 [bacterium]